MITQVPTYKFLLPRRFDWTTRWVEFMQDSKAIASDLKLDWHNLNCLEWCCMWIEECTGQNPYDEVKEEASSLLGAASAIKNRGFQSLDQLIGSYLPSSPVGMLQQGDMVMVKTPPEWGAEDGALAHLMPHGCALADPPFYWCVTQEGLGRGLLYEEGVSGFLIGGLR